MKKHKNRNIAITIFAILIIVSLMPNGLNFIVTAIANALVISIFMTVVYLFLYIIWSIQTRFKSHKNYKDRINDFENQLHTLENDLILKSEALKVLNKEKEDIKLSINLSNENEGLLLQERLSDLQQKIKENEETYEKLSTLCEKSKKKVQSLDESIAQKKKELNNFESKIYRWRTGEAIELQEVMLSKNIQAMRDEEESLKHQINEQYEKLKLLNKAEQGDDIFRNIVLYKDLLDQGLLTQEQFDKKKEELIGL